ncbi:MAG: hypothetical protein AAF599_13450 [Bacteroidota bacterium]
MPVKFSDDALPLTDESSLDSLHEDIPNLVTDWYGELTEFTHPEKGSLLLCVDGNLRIRVSKGICKK